MTTRNAQGSQGSAGTQSNTTSGQPRTNILFRGIQNNLLQLATVVATSVVVIGAGLLMSKTGVRNYKKGYGDGRADGYDEGRRDGYYEGFAAAPSSNPSPQIVVAADPAVTQAIANSLSSSPVVH